MGKKRLSANKDYSEAFIIPDKWDINQLELSRTRIKRNNTMLRVPSCYYLFLRVEFRLRTLELQRILQFSNWTLFHNPLECQGSRIFQ